MDSSLTVTTRITTIRLLELMKKQPEYAKQMGLMDVSHYNGMSELGNDCMKSCGRTK